MVIDITPNYDLRAFITSGKDGILNLYNLYNYKYLRSFKHPENVI